MQSTTRRGDAILGPQEGGSGGGQGVGNCTCRGWGGQSASWLGMTAVEPHHTGAARWTMRQNQMCKRSPLTWGTAKRMYQKVDPSEEADERKGLEQENHEHTAGKETEAPAWMTEGRQQLKTLVPQLPLLRGCRLSPSTQRGPHVDRKMVILSIPSGPG